MESLPFTDPPDDVSLHDQTPPPKATGLRRVVVAAVVGTLCFGGAALWLLGSRTWHQMGKRVRTAPVEAAPRPANTGDPLKGVPVDYAALLARPEAPPPAVKPPVTPPAAPAPMAPAKAPAKEAKPQRDAGMLVLEGKRQAAQQRQAAVPAMPQIPATDEAPAEKPEPVGRNQAFLQQASVLRETRVQDTLHTPESPHMVLAGDFLPAVLVQGIASGLPGELVARLSRDVRDSVEGKTVLLPQGTHILGAYNSDLAYGQDRVLVAWHRLRLPNGQSIQLQGMPGIDISGFTGLKDKVDHHLWPLFRAVILSSVLGIGARVPAGNPQGYIPTLGQEVAQDVGQGINQAGQAIVRRELQRQPTVTVRAGMQFNIFVLRDLILAPYTGAVARKP
jgi:type IV secretory pathway VirB10-like protein